MTEKQSILQEAEELTNGARQQDYGHPADDFAKTAKMWSVIFGFEVTAEQVPLAMVAVKISRQLNRPTRDNLVDIAGYANTLDMVIERKVKQIMDRKIELEISPPGIGVPERKVPRSAPLPRTYTFPTTMATGFREELLSKWRSQGCDITVALRERVMRASPGDTIFVDDPAEAVLKSAGLTD